MMKKSWFMQLGGFDPGMKIWGSEQFELSAKERFILFIYFDREIDQSIDY